jgi:hypothetical protein
MIVVSQNMGDQKGRLSRVLFRPFLVRALLALVELAI